jgi:hypothetical protein
MPTLLFSDFMEIYDTKVSEKGGNITELKKLKVTLTIHLYHFLLLLFRESYIRTRYSAPFRLGSVLYTMRTMKSSMMGYWLEAQCAQLRIEFSADHEDGKVVNAVRIFNQ